MPYPCLPCRGAVVIVVVSLVTGCGFQSVESTSTKTTATEHAEDSGHQHGETGPNGGHIIELDQGQYHAEWLHDDESEKVTVVLLDDKPAQEVAISADYVTIDLAVGDQRNSYQLKAVRSSDRTATPEASRFELVSPSLLVGLKMGEGVDATLTVNIGEKTYAGPIEHQAHDQLDHHHH